MDATYELLDFAQTDGWRVSPLATAIHFSRREGIDFQPAAHLKLISDAIVDAEYDAGPKFIAVSMPPRHGKSWLISRRTPERFLANNPDKAVMVVGYGSSFAKDWGRTIRNDIEFHSELIGMGIADDSSAADMWHTTAGGVLHTAGVKADIIGFGADLLIIDDPIKNWQEANSPEWRDMIWNMWRSTLRSRLHPGAIVIVVMQRWHEDDLIGRILRAGDAELWREIRLPAIWDDEAPQVAEFSSGQVWKRERGQALWPARYDEKTLDNIKRGTSEVDGELSLDVWNAMFQQDPAKASSAGLVYKEFSKADNVQQVERDPYKPLVWCLDFNVDPMCSLICEWDEEVTHNSLITGERLVTVKVLDEIILPNSSTPEALAEFKERFAEVTNGRAVDLHVYGDASGDHRNTAGAPTDWVIIKKGLSGLSKARVHYHLDAANPRVKDRVNSVNAMLCNAARERKLFVHPRCKELIKDFERIHWKRDAKGNPTHNMDKSDVARTHASDALGYFIHKKFGLKGSVGERAASAV